jgi:magnesium-protoporphyrin IX monomethyl ester (oxidative) cyclase
MKPIQNILITVAPIDPKSDAYENNRIVTPAEPLSLATVLSVRGFRVFLHDMGLHRERRDEMLRAVLASFRPDLVFLGFPLLTFNFDEWDGGQTFRIVKDFDASIVTVFSGAHVVNFPERALENPHVDFIVRGEYDHSVPALVDALATGGSPENIGGIGYRREGRPWLSPARTRTELAALPVPDVSLLELESYFRFPEVGKIRYPEKSRRWADLQFSRGCVHRCSFCNVNFLRGERYRRKTTRQIAAEIGAYLDAGVEEIHVMDDLFAASRRDVEDVVETLRGLDRPLHWFAGQGFPLRTVDETLLAELKDSGMYRLIAPFESGSNRVLREIIRKPLTVEHSARIAEACRKLDIELIGLFVIGSPGERLDEIRETVRFAREHDIDYSVFSIATPQVGTELLKTVEEKNLLPGGYGAVQKVVKRTTALFATEEFTAYDLEQIRYLEWVRVNFAREEKKRKYARMVGLDLDEVDGQIAANSRFFHDKYGKGASCGTS